MNLSFLNTWILMTFLSDFLTLGVSSREQCSCGQINDSLDSRIVGGTSINQHKYPWLAVILKKDNFHCGGSVINNYYVLTAAHCVHEGNIEKVIMRFDLLKVVLGVHDRANENENTRRYYNVATIKAPVVKHTCNMHEIHDLALIKTDEEIFFSWAISPICLPQSPEFNYVGKIVSVAGWGTVSFRGHLSRYPREANIKILEDDDCLAAVDVGYHFAENPTAMFCAYKTGVDACKGDSGGPVSIEINNTMVQVGVVSWGIECALDYHPGVYTRLPLYLFWVFQNTLDAKYCDS